MMESKEPEFPALEIGDFLFNAPLYKIFSISSDAGYEIIYGRQPYRADGHCVECGKQSTFKLHGQHIPGGDPWDNREKRFSHDTITLKCSRNEYHQISMVVRVKRGTIQKIGQFPSLADIANDESKAYRAVLKGEDSADFHRAIGLAAHGIGIGSFVYLRRVFERLIQRRFNEYKSGEGWSEEAFSKLRMQEKVEFLKGHLPDFMVQNSRIYSILSLGVHELKEKTCLGFFEVLKKSIIVILEEDDRRMKDEAMRKELSSAIASFTK